MLSRLRYWAAALLLIGVGSAGGYFLGDRHARLELERSWQQQHEALLECGKILMSDGVPSSQRGMPAMRHDLLLLRAEHERLLELTKPPRAGTLDAKLMRRGLLMISEHLETVW